MTRLTAQRVLLSAVLSSGLGIAAFAQTSQDPRQPNRSDVPTDTRNADARRDNDRMENRPHMTVLRENFGLNVRPLPRDQAAAHDLKPGVGLIVEDVTLNSIAANGKLQKGDVIFKVGDQWVINPEQLATLLSIQDVNDGFEIKVHRGTDRIDLDYKFDQAALDTMSKSLEPAMGVPDQRMDRSMDRSRNNESLDRNNPMIIPEKFDFKDDRHAISIRTENGVKKLLVKDKDGNVLFDGPYNSAQDRDAVPADIREKVERVLREKVK